MCPALSYLQLFRIEVLFNERKHFVLRRNSEFQNLHRKVWSLFYDQSCFYYDKDVKWDPDLSVWNVWGFLCCYHIQLRKIVQTPDFPSKRNQHLRTKPLEQRRQELEDYVQVRHLRLGLRSGFNITNISLCYLDSLTPTVEIRLCSHSTLVINWPSKTKASPAHSCERGVLAPSDRSKKRHFKDQMTLLSMSATYSNQMKMKRWLKISKEH